MAKTKKTGKKRKAQFKMSIKDAQRVRGLLLEVRSIGAKYRPTKKKKQYGLGL